MSDPIAAPDPVAAMRDLAAEARAEALHPVEAALTDALEAAAADWPTHRCATVEAVARFATALAPTDTPETP